MKKAKVKPHQMVSTTYWMKNKIGLIILKQTKNRKYRNGEKNHSITEIWETEV